jgi:hypothetical protein
VLDELPLPELLALLLALELLALLLLLLALELLALLLLALELLALELLALLVLAPVVLLALLVPLMPPAPPLPVDVPVPCLAIQSRKHSVSIALSTGRASGIRAPHAVVSRTLVYITLLSGSFGFARMPLHTMAETPTTRPATPGDSRSRLFCGDLVP